MNGQLLNLIGQLQVSEGVNPFALVGGAGGKQAAGAEEGQQATLFTEFLQTLLGQGEALQSGDMTLQGQILPQPAEAAAAEANPLAGHMSDEIWNQLPADVQGMLRDALAQLGTEVTQPSLQVDRQIAEQNTQAADGLSDEANANLNALRNLFLQEQEQSSAPVTVMPSANRKISLPSGLSALQTPSQESLNSLRKDGEQALNALQQSRQLLNHQLRQDVTAMPAAAAQLQASGGQQSQPDFLSSQRQQQRLHSLMSDSVSGGEELLAGDDTVSGQSFASNLLNGTSSGAFRPVLQELAGQHQMPLASEPSLSPTQLAVGWNTVGQLPTQVDELAKSLPQPHAASYPTAGEQVVVQIKQAVAQGNDMIRVQLNPVELGAVEIKISLHKDAIHKISFHTERADTLEMLQRDRIELERMLQDAGFSSDGQTEFSFTGGQSGQFAGRQDQPSQDRFELDFNGEGAETLATLPTDQPMSVAEAIYAFSTRGNIDIRA